MKNYLKISFAVMAVGLLSVSCTERRTASDPVADGDTVEVEIQGKKENARQPGMPEIIEVPDTVDLLKN